MKYIAIACMALLVLAGCNNRKATPTDPEVAPFVTDYDADIDSYEDDYEDFYDGAEGRSDMDSLGYYGVYEGATFTGGKTLTTTLSLYDNHRYKIHSVDVGDNARTEEEEGTYMIMGDLLTLVPDEDGDKRFYRTGDNHFTQLDENQKEVPTLHSQNFRLTRK
ncbi:MAG: copper resistance protein NlpE N-terminal domain-containing protein [Tannerellaceae bacterium]|nr:copper resistance protein NlpE N-terminal domain-containing protein [Tannerellaceae bacterium]